MAALDKARDTEAKTQGMLQSYPVNAESVIYAGALVIIDAQGYARPAANTADFKAAGRAEELADNTGGADGDISVKVREGLYHWGNKAGDLVDQAMVGLPCYVEDDQTVRKTVGNVVAGIVKEIDDDGVWVATFTGSAGTGAVGPAGGDLTGTYPDPTIAAGALSADATGRAKVAADFFDAAAALAKFGTDSIANAFLLKAIENGAFVADAATRALFGDGFVTQGKTATFFSTEVVATGSAQDVAHGLGVEPAAVLIVPQSHNGTPDTGAFDIAEGAHDITNVKFTATADMTVKILAWA